ncbi:hypothetical protein PH552_12090 [Rhizobium sp. CNPSo 3968]|uniref:hypothetical protein n=1 Tax=Rhizobium sp. CNPSo 3968 TaxID=3021408 RepID=UPI00254EEE13|nr:hypothetical protein [Rhizobium sp. CNPSo 3968]MDK4720084.1 hypothetical protein [Rhizobium sp. CNPSo 3968]
MTTPHDKALEAFTDYFVRNYPGPDTIIFDPKWHAPKLFNAAMKAIQAEIEIGSAADLISDWLGEGTEDLPDDTPVRVEIGKRSIISDTLGNLRASLHTPIEAGNGGDGWLDISSAPKSGESILADHAEWGEPEIVAWNDGEDAWCTGSWCWKEAPTHWRPLPARRSSPSNEGERP